MTSTTRGAGSAEAVDVTHGFCLADARWLHAILAGNKIVENRPGAFAPGWYGFILSKKAFTTPADEVSYRLEFPDFRFPSMYRTNRVEGLAKFGYALPQSACRGNRWSSPAHGKVANIITHVLPFEEGDGVPVRGNVRACYELKDATAKVREAARRALAKSDPLATGAEAVLPPPPPVDSSDKKRKRSSTQSRISDFCVAASRE